MGRNPWGQNWWVSSPEALQESPGWPQLLLETGSTTLRRLRYSTSASRASAEPRSAVRPDRRLIDRLGSHCDAELVGGDDCSALRRQLAMDVRLSARSAEQMLAELELTPAADARCAGFGFAHAILHDLQKYPAAVSVILTRHTGCTSPSHISSAACPSDVRISSGSSW